MTGTSIDGDLDAAIIAVHGRGLDMRAPLVHGQSFPLGALADDLRRVASGAAMTARDFTRLAHAFGLLHAEAIAELCDAASARPDLVVLHGQTVMHAPPLSWQLVNPWPVAVRLGCPVRYDLRAANLSSGGQGAPITPLADFVLYGEEARAKTILNLGGFANATLLPARSEGPGAIRGLDLCPCNHLLDRVAHTRLGRAFDQNGRAARQGRPDESIAAAIAEMAMAPAQALAAHGRRSLGSGDEAADAIDRTTDLSPEDACATVVEAVARMLADGLAAAGHALHAPIVVAGGSARHQVLCDRLAQLSGSPVETSDVHAGIPCHLREAAAIAVLGALSDDGMRYSLAQVTGAESAVPESGVIGR
jgi:1,6-anhydro-N-acetylmuramate kinase